jgi:hypothetical protein
LFFVCICTLTCVRRVLEMAPKQQRVDFASIPISKEEREMDTEIEFAALSERLQEKELRPKKKTFKRPLGRPRKERRAMLLKPKVEMFIHQLVHPYSLAYYLQGCKTTS